MYQPPTQSGDCLMSETDALFAALRQAADPQVVGRIEHLVAHGSDRDLNRINTLAFAASHSFDDEKVIAAFLHAARIGAFEMAWNVLCPGCGGVLDSSATLKTVNRDQYHCSLCRSEEHTSELQSRQYLVCRLLLEKKKYKHTSK